MRRPALILTMALITIGIARAQQTPSSAVQLPGTRLSVTLPEGWRLDPPRTPAQTNTLTRTSPPRYDLSVSQTNAQSIGYSCMNFIGSMQAIGALQATVRPRPSFVPDTYLGSMLDITSAQLVCLSAGDSEVAVMIQPVGGSSNSAAMTPMLTAIADAALKQSGAVASPGRIKLQILGVEIPVRSGTWGVRTGKDTWGTNDILGRQARPGSNELFITPFVFRVPGRCEQLGATSPIGTSSASYVKGRRYGGDKWHPDAWEQQPPPFRALQAYACRNVGTNSILLARIDYEKPTVTDEDRIAIRQILDDVGDAVEAKVPRTGAAQPPSNAFFIDPQVLSSNPQGVDLGPYLNAVNNRIRANWFAVMPETARNGQQGRVDVLFAIARDGSIQDLRLVATSRNDALDQAATIAIQTSNPLPPLPAEFKGDRMALRYAFLYNLTPAR